MAAALHDCRFAGGMSASGQSAGFGGNLFTRDTLRVLRDLIGLPGYQSFIRQMLGILPQWQGIKENDATNEFPDALPHQVFRQRIGGLVLPEAQVANAEYWTEQWGVAMDDHPVNGRQFIIYNSSDGPLLYLITLGEFCRTAGNGVLKDLFHHYPTDTTRTVAEAARRCVSYVAQALKRHGDDVGGLYAIPNTNAKQTSPSGVMRDGFDAYIGRNGKPVEYSLAAYVENQALAYEALRIAAHELFPEDPEAVSWLRLAEQVRTNTLKELWMSERNFFAAAFDKHGPLHMVSSAAFELLNGPFFKGLRHQPDYVQTLVTELYSPQFMTPIGPRMTSLEHANLEGEYYAYQGSGAVWGVTTGIVAAGLRYWGLDWLARDVGRERLVEGLNRVEEAVELMYVDRNTGEPLYRSARKGRHAEKGEQSICAAELGQPDQAWTASAALGQLHAVYPDEPKRDTWQASLTQRVREAVGVFPTASEHTVSGRLYADLSLGSKLRDRRAAALGLSA